MTNLRFVGRLIAIGAIGVILAACASVNDELGALSDSQPEPGLSPLDVVQIQLLAFGNNTEDDAGIEIAYRFASPANRVVTGPLDRFATMIKGGVYSVMLSHDRAEYADTMIRGDSAIQRVALYTDGQVLVFDFILRRQVGEPYDSCWMTEGVYFVGMGRSEDEQAI
jgi:hypothetical protein